MSITNINHIALNFEHSDIQRKLDLDGSLPLLNQATATLKLADPIIEFDSLNLSELVSILSFQEKSIRSMSINNPEDSIALSLSDSIDDYTKQLEDIQNQTSGLGAFESSLDDIWVSISQKSPLTGYDLEDAFQLALMSALINSSDYSLSAAESNALVRFLECTGSGSHGSHEYWDGPEFASSVTGLFNTLYSQAPQDSLVYDILYTLKFEAGCPKALEDQFTNNWGTLDSWYNDWNNGVGNLSPILRMAILSSLLEDVTLNLSQSNIDTILTGSLADIDGLLMSLYGYNTITYINTGLDGWNYHYVTNPTESVGYGLNFWASTGVTVNYFTDLSEELPRRPLTEEEIKEVNNIGDQVKMLHQTLKYWLQICRDEQLAIARNI